ncbi:MAG: CotH kinase family protein [Prevotella sp.]|nr:CotH kinase family protein [Prevotella sp.]
MKKEIQSCLLLLTALICLSEKAGAQTAFEQKIASLGIVRESLTDWSDESKIEIPEPNCAYVNITNISSMPTTKTDDAQAWIEVYDCNGNYFKKRVVLNAQGNSSMGFVKKNFAADFCEDEWVGDKTTDISIGDWVKQDSYHFKAYYTDFFRGISIIGYKLYDQITADRGRIWTRAGLDAPDEKARCYPDGFPCIVYLNGDFYGVFSWQLKKNRKNYNLTKDVAEHVHLDGTLSQAYLWNGTIDWTQFEVRNPKTLYCIDTEVTADTKAYAKVKDDAEAESVKSAGNYIVSTDKPSDLTTEQITAAYGDNPPTYLQYEKNSNIFKLSVTAGGTTYKKYDGDNPKELIDETMTYYDPTNSGHVQTNKVKQYIVALSKRYTELKTLESSGATKDVMRNKIAEYFDVPGLIDYWCFFYAVNNRDGMSSKNWQWFTYDGTKWFVGPYDLDCTFGAIWTGNFTLPAEWGWVDGTKYTWKASAGPQYFIGTYYWDDIKTRYAELRDNGVLTPENLKSIVENWYYRVSETNYGAEQTKWPASPCYGETVCNTNWTTVDDWTGYNSIADYSATKTYQAGDKCRLANRIWTATGETTGIRPYSKIGHTDNLTRVENWIDRRFELEDDYLGYTEPSESLSSYTLQMTNAGWATVCVPFAFTVPEGLKAYTVTGIDNSGALAIEQTTKTEANKPYLVSGTTGFYHLTGYAEAADESSDDYLVNRLLKGTYAITHAPKDCYVLQNHNNNVRFYRVTNDDEVQIAANRAWLLLPEEKDSESRLLWLSEENTTGVNTLQIDGNKRVYSLSGIKRSKPKSGINIVQEVTGTTKKVVTK